MATKVKIEGVGYSPLKDYGSWRIATLLPAVTNHKETLKVFGKHNTTDEVFVLLRGTAYMVTAGQEEQVSDIKVMRLEKETLFVVHAGEWHAAILEDNSQLLIVENQDTSNSCSVEITKQQLEQINELLTIL